jgi:hypothetical protein
VEGTSPRAELMGALIGLELLAYDDAKHDVELTCDAEYVVHGIQKLDGMLRTNFRPGGVPMVNADLWEDIAFRERMAGGKITSRWVRGHSGYAPNEVVDRLAKVGALFASVGLSGVFLYVDTDSSPFSMSRLLGDTLQSTRYRNKWAAEYARSCSLPDRVEKVCPIPRVLRNGNRTV